MPEFPRVFRFLSGLTVAIVAILVMQFSGTVRPAKALSSCDVYDPGVDDQEQAFLSMINGYRAQYGLAPLSLSTNLTRSSAWMAQDLATHYGFSHTDSSGRYVDQRGYDCGALAYLGENIAGGTYLDSAQSVFNVWRASSGHNANMLNANYRQIGIARYYNPGSTYAWYWVTDFSTSDDGTGTYATTVAAPPPPALDMFGGRAEIVSPISGYIPASGVTLAIQPASGASQYWLEIGTTYGAKDLYDASLGLQTSVWVGGFPIGATVYMRLWTLTGAGWEYQDYTYQTTM
jgi:uncharacterized protein YkwD